VGKGEPCTCATCWVDSIQPPLSAGVSDVQLPVLFSKCFFRRRFTCCVDSICGVHVRMPSRSERSPVPSSIDSERLRGSSCLSSSTSAFASSRSLYRLRWRCSHCACVQEQWVLCFPPTSTRSHPGGTDYNTSAVFFACQSPFAYMQQGDARLINS